MATSGGSVWLTFIIVFRLLVVLQGHRRYWPPGTSPYGGPCAKDSDCVQDYYEDTRCVNPFSACYVNDFTYPDSSLKVCPTINTTRDIPVPACVGVPDSVQDVQISQITRTENNSKLSFNVTWAAPTEYVGPLVYYLEVYGDFHEPDNPRKTIVASADEDTFLETFENMDGTWNYSIYVTAITAAGHSRQHPPLRITNTRPYFHSDVPVMSPSQHRTSFGVTIRTSFLTGPNQGHVTAAAIMLCDVRRSYYCQPSYVNPGSEPLKVLKAEDIGLLPTWTFARNRDFDGPYRTTADDFLESLKKELSSEFFYVLGGSDCDKMDRQTFCNGPLHKESDFRATLILCNDVGCTEAPLSTETFSIRTASEVDKEVIIVVLAVALALSVLMCIALAFYITCPNRSAKKYYEYDSKLNEQEIQ